MKTLIIIPTLNEASNILILIKKIFSLYSYNVLVIDDNSTDGTIKKLEFLKRRYKKLKYIVRKKEKGIGSAHLKGIQYAYKFKYDFCISMDADGTHDPKEIKKMLIYKSIGLADLLLLFLYLEVLAMIRVFWHSQSIRITLPLLIAITALSRFIILQGKEQDPSALVYEAVAIVLIALAIVIIRLRHSDKLGLKKRKR